MNWVEDENLDYKRMWAGEITCSVHLDWWGQS